MIERLQQTLFPRVVARVRQNSLEHLMLIDQRWQAVSAEQCPKGSLFGQTTLLVPDECTLFRLRSFPVAHVKESELNEALALDIETWSPWGSEWESFVWPSREGELWSVAVWIWPKDAMAELIRENDLSPTHVIAECAWRVAVLNAPQLPAIFVDENSDGGKSCAVLSSSGAPLSISEFLKPGAFRRFWLMLDESVKHYPLVALTAGEQESFVGEQKVEVVGYATPSYKAMKYARQEGVKDWTDAFSWAKPAAFLFAAYFVWLLGSTLILWQKGESISQQVSDTSRKAVEVVDQREKVTEIHQKLLKIRSLRTEQLTFERVLATISRTLPRGAWLNTVQFTIADGGWVELTGRAAESSGIAAIFEELPEIEHAMFLGNIRKDKSSGLELFKIRLKLKAASQ